MRQPVLPLPPADATPIGGHAGLVENADGGVVCVAGHVAFTPAARVPTAGLALILATPSAAHLLAAFNDTYGRLADGFYGLNPTVLTLLFLALLRDMRAEGLTRHRPVDLGRLLGLDRAPEVKTLRRKLAELAGRSKGAQLQAALARAHAAGRPDLLGWLHVDGHTRAYFGRRDLPKTLISRTHMAGRASGETWVGDVNADPLLVIPALPTASLAAELVRALPDLGTLVGDERRVSVIFDRGGWSPATFAKMIDVGFEVLTYRKAPYAPEPDEAFTTLTYTDPDGGQHTYQVAESTVTFDVADGKTVSLRQVMRRTADGKQIAILTSATAPAGEVCWRMSGRWRQENFFRYAREHFALDALDSYADTAEDPDRLVVNPAKLRTHTQVDAAPTVLHAAQSLLDTETKLITHAVLMAAYNAETTLARAEHYSRADDEARALIREAFALSGDLVDDQLHVTLDPASAPRRTRALTAVCEQLTTVQATYPGTNLKIRHAVKPHPTPS